MMATSTVINCPKCGKPATEFSAKAHDRRGGPTRCHWFKCEDGHVTKVKAKR